MAVRELEDQGAWSGYDGHTVQVTMSLEDWQRLARAHQIAADTIKVFGDGRAKNEMIEMRNTIYGMLTKIATSHQPRGYVSLPGRRALNVG